MTILEVVTARLKPYVLPDDSIQVLILDQGLDESDDYEPQIHKTVVSQVLIKALWQCISLTEESDNGSKQKYNTEALLKRIKNIEDELNITQARPQHVDITEYW